jgi:hypothetical protein
MALTYYELPAPAVFDQEGYVSMFRELARGYYRLRYLPRHVFAVLSEIKEQVAELAHTVAELNQDLNAFRDGAAAVLLSVNRRARALEESIAKMKDSADELSDFVKRQDLEGAIAKLSDCNADLSHFLKLQARTFPTWLWSPEASARARSILSLLTPFRASEARKIRIGRDFDGGYVMLDDFLGITHALSFGIADDASWDLDIASRDIPVLQFDPKVAASPVSHPLFSFEQLRIAPVDYAGAISLETILRTRVPSVADTLLLKIDVEGAEWEVLACLTDDVLIRFRQIVCEFHTLDRLVEPEFGDRAQGVFERLTKNHFVCHVHGNNCGNFVNVGNIPIPQSLEITFASRVRFTPSETAETFPTSLDRPNERNRADLYLGGFRFNAS